MEYLFIILFIYASYLSIEKYVHTGSIFTWRGRKDKKERRTAFPLPPSIRQLLRLRRE